VKKKLRSGKTTPNDFVRRGKKKLDASKGTYCSSGNPVTEHAAERDNVREEKEKPGRPRQTRVKSLCAERGGGKRKRAKAVSD